MAGTRRHTFRNLVGHVKGVSDMNSLAAWTNEQFDPRLSWADVAWVKEQWGGQLILKGIMVEEDARLAVQHGADAIVVSNHGGRQLDGAPSTIHALPAIVDAGVVDHAAAALQSRGATGYVPGTRMERSTFWMLVWPQKAMLTSSSLWMICRALVTPASPKAPRP